MKRHKSVDLHGNGVLKTVVAAILAAAIQTPVETLASTGALSQESGKSGPILEGWIDGATFTNRKVVFEDVDGWAIFEGDIVLGRTEDLVVPPEERIVPYGTVITGDRFRWPDGIVPYVVDPDFSDTMVARITDAMAHWVEHTAIEFVERTAGNADRFPDFVQFTVADGVCSSFVGRRETGMQNVNLGNGCGTGSVIHEIGHAIGLWHEQSREDRDEYVEINWENIESGRENNFNQHISDGDDVGAYDYGSIMHYGRTAFSNNGEDTIVPVDPDAEIGQRDGLSTGDIATTASMYGPNIVNEATHWGYGSNGSSFFRSGFQRLGTQFSESHPWVIGDFDGDGRDDAAQVYSRRGTSKVFVYRSDGTVLSVSAKWLGADYSDDHIWRAGDFNGDGLDDLVLVYGHSKYGATAWIYTSNGSGFSKTSAQRLGAGFWESQRWETGDFNGDGMDDLVLVYGHSKYGATAWIYSSNGSGFSKTHSQRMGAGFWESQRWETGDFNGDGLDDLVLVYGHSKYGATAWTYSSNGSGFSKTHSQRMGAGFWESQRWETGDFDGDGMDDLVLVYGHSKYGATAWTYGSNGSSFVKTGSQRLDARFWVEQIWLPADLDGDGLDGLSLFYGHTE